MRGNRNEIKAGAGGKHFGSRHCRRKNTSLDEERIYFCYERRDALVAISYEYAQEIIRKVHCERLQDTF